MGEREGCGEREDGRKAWASEKEGWREGEGRVVGGWKEVGGRMGEEGGGGSAEGGVGGGDGWRLGSGTKRESTRSGELDPSAATRRERHSRETKPKAEAEVSAAVVAA